MMWPGRASPHEAHLYAPDIGDPVFVAECRQRFASADPFPHLVIDGLFDLPLLARIHAEFDARDDPGRSFDNGRERTWRSLDPCRFGPAAAAYFDRIHRHDMVQFLSGISGITPLVVDHSLLNGGMHECPDGGRFDIHRDFNRHRHTMLDNALVAITYLNPDWREDWGGELGLWCHRRRRVVQRIAPLLGRTVIFAHGPHSYHGHTRPVNTGGKASRRSLATYFYTTRPSARDKIGYHSTVFAFNDRGDFAPGDLFTPARAQNPRQRLNSALRLATPPALWNLARHWLGDL